MHLPHTILSPLQVLAHLIFSTTLEGFPIRNEETKPQRETNWTKATHRGTDEAEPGVPAHNSVAYRL